MSIVTVAGVNLEEPPPPAVSARSLSAARPPACLPQTLEADSEPLTAWICKQLAMGRGRGEGVRGAVQALCVLLRNEDARVSFGRHGGVAYLTKIIRMQVLSRAIG